MSYTVAKYKKVKEDERDECMLCKVQVKDDIFHIVGDGETVSQMQRDMMPTVIREASKKHAIRDSARRAVLGTVLEGSQRARNKTREEP